MSLRLSKTRRTPAWLMTFADLVTILLAFFVLLLSFSKTDLARYQQLSGAMSNAFDDPLGGVLDRVGLSGAREVAPDGGEWSPAGAFDRGHRRLEDAYFTLSSVLWRPLQDGKFHLELTDGAVVVRFDDLALFYSGSDRLTSEFRALIALVSTVLSDAGGMIVVQGHTDDLPISRGRFQSNWELSAARAVSVVEALLQNPGIEPSRIVVEGHADNRPLVPNDNAANRSRNRRVEIRITENRSTDI